MSSPAAPILAFDRVTTEAALWPAADLVDFSLTLGPGELALVRFDRREGPGPLPEVATGLIEPDAGTVHFQGRDWADRRPTSAGRARGRIGRYFGRHGWVHHLDVDENVTLRERHHTRRPTDEIEAEAHRLAVALGLADGLPTDRPGKVDPRVLQRAACVRMLLGQPPLLLLDEPAAGLPGPLVETLVEQVRLARGRGSAVVWLTADPAVWQNRTLSATSRIDRSHVDGAGARQPWQSPSSSAT